MNAGASKYELTIKNLSVTDYLIRDVIPDEEVLKLVDAEDEKEERVRSNKEPSPKQWWELDNHHDEGDDDNHHPDEDGLSDIHIRRPSAASDEDESRIIDMEALSLEVREEKGEKTRDNYLYVFHMNFNEDFLFFLFFHPFSIGNTYGLDSMSIRSNDCI